MNALSGSLLGSFLALLGSFLKHFSVPGSTLGALWAHFLNQKSALGSKGAPRGATPEINSPFWRPVGTLFLNMCVFLLKKGFWNRLLFFFNFLVTLSAPRDGLICNPYAPAQSKRSFSFSHFFWKVGPKRPHLGSMWETCFVQNCNLEWKKGLNKLFKKSGPPLANKGLWPWPGAPWQPPSRARFSEQETTIWARNKNSCSFLNPFQSPFPGMGYFLISCLKKCSFFDEIWNKKDKSPQLFFSYGSFPKARDLTRSGPRPGEFIEAPLAFERARVWHLGRAYLHIMQIFT